MNHLAWNMFMSFNFWILFEYITFYKIFEKLNFTGFFKLLIQTISNIYTNIHMDFFKWNISCIILYYSQKIIYYNVSLSRLFWVCLTQNLNFFEHLMLHLFYLLMDLESHDVLETSSLLPMPKKLVCQFKTYNRLN